MHNNTSNIKGYKIYGSYLLMLIAPAILSFYFYGYKSLIIVLVSLLSSILFDMFFSILLSCERKKDFFSIYNGLVISMLMPAGVPLHIPVIACAFSIILVKIPFGGGMKSPFVPAATGMAFCFLCFRSDLYNFSATVNHTFISGKSIASMLASGSSIHINNSNLFEILSGNVVGPIGTTCFIVLLGCSFFLALRRHNTIFTLFGFLISLIFFVLLFPRTNAIWYKELLLELCSGSLMFCVVFFLTDYASMPQKFPFSFIYGFIFGTISSVMRRVGPYEDPSCFALILTNVFSIILNSNLISSKSESNKRSVKEVDINV